MTSIDGNEYRKHMGSVVRNGFTLDPPGYERLSAWTCVLMHLINARVNFESVLNHPTKLGDLHECVQEQAFLVAGIMAYGRCYASSGLGIPTLDAKKVYVGSEEGMAVHQRLIGLRNKFAAHADHSDLLRLTLAVREAPDRIVVKHLATSAMPTPEIPEFLEAVAHSEHFATVFLNKQLDSLATKFGKPISVE